MLIFCMKNKNVGYGPICNGGEMVLSHKSFRIILLGILFAEECIYASYICIVPLTSERKMVTLIDIHRSFVVDVWSMEPWLAL